MNCKVCGKPSGKYFLCKECNQKKEEGLLIKKDNGDWVLLEHSVTEKTCILCGANSKYDLCYSCYQEKNTIKQELLESTSNLEDTKDYYNNLKYNIFKLKDMNYAITACNKLIALGEILEEKYGCKDYIAKSKKDSVDLLEKKKAYLLSLQTDNKDGETTTVTDDGKEKVVEEIDSNTEWQDFRRVYPMNIRCQDGHYVRSLSEKVIDDYLFGKKIIHVYEKRVLNKNNGETYYPDFYLPYIGKGIYIEFFGLEDNEKYLATEEKKLKYYKSQGFDVIEVRKKHIECIDDYLELQIDKIIKKYM